MYRSDSGADTRDSENTFPASLADERKRGRGGEAYGARKETKRGREERKEKVKGGEMKVETRALSFFNSLDSNFSPIVCISIIVVAVIKHFGNVGDFLFLKPPCQ